MADLQLAGTAFHSHASGEKMKKTALWALPFAATLAITGCAAESTPDPAAQPSSGATPTPATASDPATQPSSGAATEPAATTPESHAASGKQLTANQLVKVAQTLKKEYGKDDAQILKDAELRASMGTIEEIVSGMKVSPAECGEFAVAGISETLEQVTMAVLLLPAEPNDVTTSISIASYPDAEFLEKLVQQAGENKVGCSKFTLTMQGQEASAEVKDAKASTTAQTTIATVTDVKVLGQEITTLTVAGYDGQSNVSVSISQPEDMDKAVAKAEKYIDLALQHIAGQ
ncbi:hypothetical protein ACIPVK_06205 [Paeniglutamicibacter sp. MACA_103]|uniref:hypothetical protein n=1 Tax=Paeniglutamicibacter sp. MACA_103 TaxID=3377337 RepID=UPI003895E13A